MLRYGKTFFALIASLLLLTACQRASLDSPISATTDWEFQFWMQGKESVFSPQQIKEIEEARQQLRFAIMTKSPGLPRNEASDRLYAKIDGKSVRSLLLHGYDLKIARAQDEIDRCQSIIRIYQGHIDNVEDPVTPAEKSNLEYKIGLINETIRTRTGTLETYEKRRSELAHGTSTGQASESAQSKS